MEATPGIGEFGELMPVAVGLLPREITISLSAC
jgi:hypothetical protein